MPLKNLIADATVLKNNGNTAYMADKLDEVQRCFNEAVLTLLNEVPPFAADLLMPSGDAAEKASAAEVSRWHWRQSLPEADAEAAREALQLLATLFCNSALLSQCQDRPLLGLYYSRLSLQCTPDYLKAKVRLAQSLVELRRLHEADVYIQTTLQEVKRDAQGPSFQGLIDELTSLQKIIPQRIKTYSSVPKILECLNGEASAEEWDVSRAYVGPVELFDDPVKGRGLRAWRPIRAGEVLLVERGYVAPEEDFTGGLLDLLDKRDDLRAHFQTLYPTKEVAVEDFFAADVRASFTAAMTEQCDTFKRRNSARRWKHFGAAEVDAMVWKKYLNACDVLGEGVGLFPWMSLFNHSCDPSAMRLMGHGMVLMFARRDIAVGEEVTHNYVPLHEPRCLRQLHLLETHGFYCACTRCASEVSSTEAITEDDITGLICPRCRTLASCRNTAASTVYGEYTVADLRYTCATCDWQMSVDAYEELYENIIDWCGALNTATGPSLASVVADLTKTEAMLPKASRLRVVLNAGYAKSQAVKGNGAEARRYVQKVEDCLRLHADPRLTVVVANMLMVVAAKGQRNLAKKELEVVSILGWDMALLRRMWDIAEPYRLQRYFYSIG